MNLLKLIKDDLKLDFTSTIIHTDGGCLESCKFEIKPREFLQFAKSDYGENNQKGFINALTNSKRAVDCQIDSVLDLYGIDYKKIPNTSESLIKYAELKNEDISYKFKLIGALNFAPSIIISKVRGLRNKLEHHYKKPTKDEVKEAIELSELFISAVENKTKFIERGFVLTDRNSFKKDEKRYVSNYNKALEFGFDIKNRNIELLAIIGGKTVKEAILVDSNMAEYYFLIRMFTNLYDEFEFGISLTYFLKYIDHPIPEKHIKISIE